MIDFLDGPAAGVTLTLKRAPRLLRVVRTTKGTWDALDQINDVPKPDEAIHVYERQGEPGTYHVDMTGKGGRREGHWFKMAKYLYSLKQPADDVARDTAQWQAWCIALVASHKATGQPNPDPFGPGSFTEPEKPHEPAN